jgi:hypothetical protein
MESTFSYDLNLCKNILETLNLPNDQLLQLNVCPTSDFDNLITVLHKDIPWGPNHAKPSMFSHPQIKAIQWFPFAPEPKYELIGNPQAVYLMIRCRLFTKLQHILNRIIQQIDCLFIPVLQFSATTQTTQVLPDAQQHLLTTLNGLTTVVPTPPEESTDVDSDTSISYSPQSPPQSSPPVQPREFTHVQTQTDEQHNQVLYFDDSPWAWLDN